MIQADRIITIRPTPGGPPRRGERSGALDVPEPARSLGGAPASAADRMSDVGALEAFDWGRLCRERRTKLSL
jgi:hypothetical protein